MKLKVACNSATNLCHSIDEHGLVERTISQLIAHAANRFACKHDGRLFLNIQ